MSDVVNLKLVSYVYMPYTDLQLCIIHWLTQKKNVHLMSPGLLVF